MSTIRRKEGLDKSPLLLTLISADYCPSSIHQQSKCHFIHHLVHPHHPTTAISPSPKDNVRGHPPPTMKTTQSGCAAPPYQCPLKQCPLSLSHFHPLLTGVVVKVARHSYITMHHNHTPRLSRKQKTLACNQLNVIMQLFASEKVG